MPHQTVVAHGYVVSPPREDYRVEIEGLEVHGEKACNHLRAEFLKFCRTADELTDEPDHLRSWWD